MLGKDFLDMRAELQSIRELMDKLAFIKMKNFCSVKDTVGTSLAVLWLRLRLPMQGVQVRSLVGELRSHVSRGQKTKA